MNITSTAANKNIYAPAKGASSAVKNSASGSFLDNIYTQPKSGSYGKVSNPMGDIDLYSELQARAVASPETIAEQKKKFADMYVPAATARKYYDPSLFGFDETKSYYESDEWKAFELEIAGERKANRAGCMLVQLGAGELPKFMDFIMDSLKSGISFEQALQNHYDSLPQIYGGGLLRGNNDWFLVNPSNGDVMSVSMGGREYTGWTEKELISDRKAAYELADDLNTFLRYAVFSQNDDDPERVSELISYIKNKQAYANFDRFLADDEKGVSETILQNLIDAGVLKGDDEDEDEEEEKAVDGLMEAIRVHQEELKENKLNIEESQKAVAELREMLDSRVRA